MPSRSLSDVRLRQPPAAKRLARRFAAELRDLPVSRAGLPTVVGPLQLTVGRAGDHPSVFQLLRTVFHGHSAAEFHAQEESPLYQPAHRWLIKRNDQVVSHLQLIPWCLQWDGLLLPARVVSGFATLPEYRRSGCGSALLAAAERQMWADGASCGLVRTAQREFFEKRGWFVCGQHCHSSAGTRQILSHLCDRTMLQQNSVAARLDPVRPARLSIRMWRHVEQAALMRLYEQASGHHGGAPLRGEEYWRWLIGRHGYHRIYVAIRGPDRFELDEQQTPIVGYAVVRQDRIVELVTADGDEEAAVQLLARACSDAIEQDQHQIRLEAPPGHLLHVLLQEAGGQFEQRESEGGGYFLVKLRDPWRFLEEQLGETLVRRLEQAHVPQPCQLTLRVGNVTKGLEIARRRLRIIPATARKPTLVCSPAQFGQLLLGHLDLRQQAVAHQLNIRGDSSCQLLQILFPALPIWYPPLDFLPAA